MSEVGIYGYRDTLTNNICKSTNKTGFYRVSRCRDKYQYCYTQDKKRKTIVANNIKDLKEKVISKGLEWAIIDSEKAIKIMERD